MEIVEKVSISIEGGGVTVIVGEEFGESPTIYDYATMIERALLAIGFQQRTIDDILLLSKLQAEQYFLKKSEDGKYILNHYDGDKQTFGIEKKYNNVFKACSFFIKMEIEDIRTNK